MQGIGAAGAVTVTGTAMVAGSQHTGTNGQTSALRVAHASPDTPTVEVFLNESTGSDGTTENGTVGNATDGETTENGTAGGNTDGSGDTNPVIEGVAYNDVSSYTEVEPGTYQMQIVASADTGIFEDVFDEEERHVIFEQEIEVAEQTSYTAVAYGKLAQANLRDGPVGTGDDTTGTDAGTDDGGVDGNVTDGGADGNATDGGVDGNATDGNVTDGGAEDGTVGNTTDGGTTNATTGGDASAVQTVEGGEVLVDQLSYGDHQYVEIEAGDHTLEFREVQGTDDGGVGTDDATGTDGATSDDGTSDGGTGDGTGGNTTENGTSDGTAGDGTTGESTDGGVDDGQLGGQQTNRAFQVAILEDELSVSGDQVTGEDGADGGVAGNETDGGTTGDGTAGIDTGTDTTGDTDQEMARLRVFHAMLDVDALTVVKVGDETTGTGMDGTTGTDGVADDGTTDGTDENDTTGGTGENATTGDGAVGTTGDTSKQTEFSAEAGTVYSGFGIGYFSPEQATGGGGTATNETVGNETTQDGMAGNETSQDGMAGNETTQDGGTTENETTGVNGTQTDDITEDDSPLAFQFITVADAQDSERVDDGTSSGSLSLSTLIEVASD